MRLAILSLVSVVATQAIAESYDLPIEASCGGRTTQSTGGFVCAYNKALTFTERTLKVKIPPTRGQIRIIDCEQELTEDGNPDDFNHQIEKSGWWLWKKTVRVLSETPSFKLPLKDYKDCPVVISVAGEDAGVQVAAIVFEPKALYNPWNIDYRCGQTDATVNGSVGICKAFEGAIVTFESNMKDREFHAIGTACGVNAESQNGRLQFAMPEGVCLVDMGRLSADGETTWRTRFLFLGQDRAARKLDNPTMVFQRGGVRVYKPQGARIISSEIYLKDKIIWRSGSRNDDSYFLAPDKDNSGKYKESGKWPDGSIVCHTAYTNEFDSMSGSCYDIKSHREVPYFFR